MAEISPMSLFSSSGLLTFVSALLNAPEAVDASTPDAANRLRIPIPSSTVMLAAFSAGARDARVAWFSSMDPPYFWWESDQFVHDPGGVRRLQTPGIQHVVEVPDSARRLLARRRREVEVRLGHPLRLLLGEALLRAEGRHRIPDLVEALEVRLVEIRDGPLGGLDLRLRRAGVRREG